MSFPGYYPLSYYQTYCQGIFNNAASVNLYERQYLSAIVGMVQCGINLEAKDDKSHVRIENTSNYGTIYNPTSSALRDATRQFHTRMMSVDHDLFYDGEPGDVVRYHFNLRAQRSTTFSADQFPQNREIFVTPNMWTTMSCPDRWATVFRTNDYGLYYVTDTNPTIRPWDSPSNCLLEKNRRSVDWSYIYPDQSPYSLAPSGSGKLLRLPTDAGVYYSSGGGGGLFVLIVIIGIILAVHFNNKRKRTYESTTGFVASTGPITTMSQGGVIVTQQPGVTVVSQPAYAPAPAPLNYPPQQQTHYVPPQQTYAPQPTYGQHSAPQPAYNPPTPAHAQPDHHYQHSAPPPAQAPPAGPPQSAAYGAPPPAPAYGSSLPPQAPPAGPPQSAAYGAPPAGPPPSAPTF